MFPKILVVSSDRKGLKAALDALSGAGYEASGASTFSQGARLLDEGSPDLLIADERLEDYNGMHLILRGRFFGPKLQAMVVAAHEDVGLERDAQSLNIPSVIKTSDPSEWPLLVSQVFGREAA